MRAQTLKGKIILMLFLFSWPVALNIYLKMESIPNKKQRLFYYKYKLLFICIFFSIYYKKCILYLKNSNKFNTFVYSFTYLTILLMTFPLTDEQIEIWLILKELQRRWTCQKIQNMEAHEVMVFTFKLISLCTYRICRLLTSSLGSVVLADEYRCFYFC